MKEVTYEDWQKNPTPRMMWCWNSSERDKVSAKVISVVKTDACIYPVLSIMKDDVGYETFRHCAEIKEPKRRRMTYKELSRWLREKPTREYKYLTSNFICCDYDYREENQDKEVHEDIIIREDDGEWREPLVEVEE